MPEIKEGEKNWDFYSGATKLNKKTFGINEPPYDNLFEEVFMQQKWYEISPVKRGFVSWSKSKLDNNPDFNSTSCSEYHSDEEANH